MLEKSGNFVRPEKWEPWYHVWHWCSFGYNGFLSELSKTHDDSDDVEEELSPTKLPKRKMDMYTLRRVILPRLNWNGIVILLHWVPFVPIHLIRMYQTVMSKFCSQKRTPINI